MSKPDEYHVRILIKNKALESRIVSLKLKSRSGENVHKKYSHFLLFFSFWVIIWTKNRLSVRVALFFESWLCLWALGLYSTSYFVSRVLDHKKSKNQESCFSFVINFFNYVLNKRSKSTSTAFPSQLKIPSYFSIFIIVTALRIWANALPKCQKLLCN